MSSRGKIDAYLDCNSPYSYFALVWLRRNRAALEEHGIDIELHPIFLGGLNVGSGNKPPWTLPAKAKLSKLDRPRAQKYFGVRSLSPPSFFPIMTLLPLRCMLYIKDNFSRDRFEDQFEELWNCYWREEMDISKPQIMAKCLDRHFDECDVHAILEGGTSPEFKRSLTDNTARLVERGAFGAPWFLVRNKDGKEEPFFGSDRWHYMLQYLDVPFTDITIQSPRSSKL